MATSEGVPPASAIIQANSPVHNDRPDGGIDPGIRQPKDCGGQHVAGRWEEEIVPLLPKDAQLIDLHATGIAACKVARAVESRNQQKQLRDEGPLTQMASSEKLQGKTA